MEDVCGVYKIENFVNGKVYVGSSKHINKRLYKHFLDLKKGKHYNQRLQQDFDEYGSTSFGFMVLEYVYEQENLFPREQHWLDETKCYQEEYGYNILSTAGSVKEYFAIPEFKEKHRQAILRRYENHNGDTFKLTSDKIREIKLLLRDTDITQRQIADIFGVTEPDILNIKKGLSGKLVTITERDQLDRSKYTEEQLTRKVLGKIEKLISEQDAKDIRILANKKRYKFSQSFIGSLFGIERRVVADVVKGKYYPEATVTDDSTLSESVLQKIASL